MTLLPTQRYASAGNSDYLRGREDGLRSKVKTLAPSVCNNYSVNRKNGTYYRPKARYNTWNMTGKLHFCGFICHWMHFWQPFSRNKMRGLHDIRLHSQSVRKTWFLALFVTVYCLACGFYPRDAMLARVIVIATCLSVRPSVRHAPVLCQNEES